MSRGKSPHTRSATLIARIPLRYPALNSLLTPETWIQKSIGFEFQTSDKMISFPAFALALLAGLRGAAYERRASFRLPVAWMLGSLFGLTAAATNGGAVLSSFWYLLLGRLVIADAILSLRAMTALAALLGLVHGYLNGTGMGQSGLRLSLSLD